MNRLLDTMTVTDNAVESRPGTGRLLDGKVTIVTGASRCIGAAAARVFADAGAAVVLAAPDGEALVKVAGEINAGGGDALVVPTDVSDPGSVERLVRRVVKVAGRLDAAFNNAGLTHPPAPLAELGIDEFDKVIAANARGAFLAMKYEIPAMLEAGGGAIVNMSSTAGERGVKGIGGYAAAKHAIVGLTQSAALDYAHRNIRVNAVAPGPILTGHLERLDAETRHTIATHVPLGRLGGVDEVARTVAWLLSDQTAFITGATIAIDGRRLAGGG
jgi:NAD(P)-dependent dehydrogenase (short-subunit alcohol dehydrogenase family)